MSNTLVSVQKFCVRNRKWFITGYLIVTTTGTVLMFRNQHEFNHFLKDHDLFKEFYKIAEDV